MHHSFLTEYHATQTTSIVMTARQVVLISMVATFAGTGLSVSPCAATLDSVSVPRDTGMPFIIRETKTQAADRLAKAPRTDRILWVPPDGIDGVPIDSFLSVKFRARDIVQTNGDSLSGRLSGKPVAQVLPWQDIRTIFVPYYSPNHIDWTDGQIRKIFEAGVLKGQEYLRNHIHLAPAKELFIVTKDHKAAVLETMLGGYGFLSMGDGRVYGIVPQSR